MKNPKHDRLLNSDLRVTTRGKLAGVALAGLALLGAKDVVAFAGGNNHEYTQEQLADMPQQQVTVQPGEGVHDEILKVDPGLMNDGQGLADVSEYVQQQGMADNHQLEAGQAVNVPVVPNQQNKNEK